MDPVGFDVLLTEFSNALKKASSPKIAKLNPPSLNADDDNDTKRKAFKEALSELSKPDNIGCLENQGILAFIAFSRRSTAEMYNFAISTLTYAPSCTKS